MSRPPAAPPLRMDPQMEEGEYLQQRLQDQIDWYDSRSVRAQRSFKRLRTVEIVLAATLPLLATGQAAIPQGALVVSLVGVAVAIIGGLLSLNQFQEKWVKYRITCEGLKQEKFRYLTRTEPYNGADAFALLVTRVENVVAQENNSWTQQTTSTAGAPRDAEADEDGVKPPKARRIPGPPATVGPRDEGEAGHGESSPRP